MTGELEVTGRLRGVVALTILGLVGACSGQAASAVKDCCVTEAWVRVIRAIELHSQESKAVVASALSDESEAVRLLAQTALEEWEVAQPQRDLAQPRLVWSPKLDAADLRNALRAAKPPLSVFGRGRVLVNGCIVDVTIDRSSGVEQLDQACLRMFRRCLFRPAWGLSGFIERDTVVSWRTHE
jgi:hypothetical protein